MIHIYEDTAKGCMYVCVLESSLGVEERHGSCLSFVLGIAGFFGVWGFLSIFYSEKNRTTKDAFIYCLLVCMYRVSFHNLYIP